MTDTSNRPDEGAEDRSACAGAQDAALKTLAAGEGKLLEVAAVLRQQPELLDLYPLPDTERVSAVRGLVQLSSADAFALVESGRVPINQAAFVGHYARRRFVCDHPLQVCQDFQMRAMSRLAESQPASAEYAIDLVDKVADDVLNEQKAEQRRLDCERIWNEPFWSVWHVLSWITFRDAVRLCEIKDENSLRSAKFYGPKEYGSSLKEAKPEYFLLGALKNDHLKAVREGAELPDIYWADKHRVDRDVQFRQAGVRRCWPGSGKAWQPENASHAQAKVAHERRKYLEQYKDQLEQGAEIRAELERTCSAQGMEAQAAPPSRETPGPIAAALDLLRDWSAADLSEAASARHAALKSALTLERATALRDLEAGKISTLAAARLFPSVPLHVLNRLPDVPLIQKVRTLVSMLNARDKRNEDDPLLTIGQTLLWRFTGARELMDSASNDSGRLGVTTAQVMAAELLDALNLPHERIQDAAHELRRLCLEHRWVAKAYDGREVFEDIPPDAWAGMHIVVDGNMTSVRGVGRQRHITVHEDVLFSRDEVLKHFSPEGSQPATSVFILNPLPTQNSTLETPAAFNFVTFPVAAGPGAPDIAYRVARRREFFARLKKRSMRLRMA
jgi:hypothetical protein